MIYDDINKTVTVRSQIDGTNWSESTSYYDGLGRTYKSEQENSHGNIFVEKEFYDDGTVKRVSNPYRANETVEWTTNIYDDAGRLVEVELQDEARILTDYGVSITGKVGTTKQITDQAGKKRKGINDVLGRMIRVIEDPSGSALETDYKFDTLGNLRETIQGVQHRYFMHDSLGRLMYSKQPEQDANSNFSGTNFADPITSNDQWSMKYVYDENGNITNITDARNIKVTATYDRLNRIVKREYDDSSTPEVNFYYDGTGLGLSSLDNSLGQTTAVKSSVSETRYTSFDDVGRILTHEQRTTAGQLASTPTEDPYETEYTYNLSGAVTKETYPSGREITHNYDEDGILDVLSGTKTGQTGAKTYLSDISYDSAGNIEKMRLGNGRWETASFNERQQITEIGLGYSANDSNLLNIEYDYGDDEENNGSLKQQTISYTGLSSDIVQNYTYDGLNRLKSAAETYNTGSNQSWKQTFEYDRYGNREFDPDPENTTTITNDDKIENPEIEESNNRLKEDQDGGGIDYDYDNNGNVAVDAENKRMVYDAENRIKEFFRGTNSGSTPDAVYQYDGEGKRVRKTADGVETVFVYNAGGQLVAEYSTQISTTPEVSYLTADHLGSPRIVSDALGNVRSRHDYLAFGDEVTITVGNVAGRTSSQGYGEEDDVRKKFTGYERDDESGLDFAQARYYNSLHGRYTSVDPLTASASIRDPQTFNRYSYVLNSPYKFTDPLGLLPETSSPDGRKCNLLCRVRYGDASKSDIALMNFHIQNQTSIGMAYLNGTGNTLSQVQDNASEQSGSAQPINADLVFSDEGRKMLGAAGMEDTYYKPYDRDSNSTRNCTVGVGHLIHSGACGSSKDDNRTYTQEEIDQFLDDDIAEAVYAVKKKIDKVRLGQEEFDALVMLAFNYTKFGGNGAPKLIAAINKGRVGGRNGRDAIGKGWGFINESGIRTEWADIKYAGGKVSNGLESRRNKELKLFFNHTYFP